MFINDLYALILITLITIVTPGPDFVVVVKNTIIGSRRAGILTALGVSTAIWIHITYSIIAVNFIANQSEFILQSVKLLGATYLIWLGCKSINIFKIKKGTVDNKKNYSSYWLVGFINNLLNPKATLFFISVFSHIVSPDATLSTQLLYGVIITIICLSWFCLVPIILTNRWTEPYLDKVISPIEKVAGVLFIGYGLNIYLKFYHYYS